MDTKNNKNIWLSSDKATLIEEYKAVLEYPPNLPDAYSHHNYWMFARLRDAIHLKGLDEDIIIKELDRKVLKDLKKYGPPAYMEEERPDYWWWHLDDIYKGTYPQEKLPEHLKALYKT